ncbi:MAG: hypothetical protein AABM40_04610 [Chloroflexota bacterium]
METASATHTIDYTVDTIPQQTDARELSASTILKNAGLDPAARYLIELRGKEQVSYKERPDAEIKMHEHARFISAALGPTPVS